MHIFYICIVPVICLCFFILFVLSRHDFAILRRNITLIQIFDKVLIATALGLILGRLTYIINSGDYYLFHFLAFFHIIRNSGFSVFGFFVGLMFASAVLFRKSKIMFRMLDVIMLAFFPVAILNAAINTFVIKNMFINIGIVLFCIIALIYFLRLNTKTKVRDGFIASVLFALICLMTLVIGVNVSNKLVFNVTFTQIISGVFLFLSILNCIYLQRFRKKK